MKQTLLPSKEEQHKAALLSQMPSWFDKGSCTFTEPVSNVQLNFRCPCSTRECGTVQRKIWVGKKVGAERAAEIARVVRKEHDKCQGAVTAQPAEEALQQEIVRLEKALAAQSKRSSEFEAANGLLKRKADQAQAAQADALVAKRVKTFAANKRQPIDSANQTGFKPGMKSHVMLGPKDYEPGQPTFIIDTLEYHCSGSERKLLTIVLDLIKRYGLADAVVGALGAATESIAGYIVKRARAALQELKQCQSEVQRQEYRLVLTALAPEDGTRMDSAVAGALGVGRKKKPFKGAIAKRAGIDSAIKANKKPLQVGDYVDCQHGKGVVVELDSDYDSESEAVAHPCAVEFDIGGNKFTSRFARSGKGKGGARLRRPAISFGHGSRASRKDSAAHLEQKVMQLAIDPAAYKLVCR
jgi:hypothetical protein